MYKINYWIDDEGFKINELFKKITENRLKITYYKCINNLQFIY